MLAADARGTISSREIAFACEQNVVFMALSARVDAGKQVLPAEMRDKEEKAIKAPEEKIATLDNWLNTEKDKISHTGLPKKSHIYDNKSAKMVSSHGVVQGYNGVAAVDGECQVAAAEAGAFGEGYRPPAAENATTGMIQKIDSALAQVSG